MNLRKIGYNIISKIKSSPVKEFIREFYFSDEEKDTLASKRLELILSVAKNNTKFYSEYNTFEEFPIISKATLRERYEDFLSNKLDKKEAVITTTSGSTGQPMTFYLSKNKKYRQNAEVIFYNNWANIDVGDYHAFVRVTNLKSKLKLFLQNEVLMNPKHLSDEWLEEQVNILNKKRVTGIIGYPSSISAIAQKANEINFNKQNFHLKGIVCTGESLKEKDAEIMEKVFGVKPISRYSTEEFGVLATSCPRCGRFHVNDTGYIVEILRLEDNMPVEVGESGRVVVTDLFSDNLPLIRFDTGDIAIYGGKSNCSFYPTGIVLESIVGRQIDTIYDIHGKAVSAFAINGSLRNFHTIKQFQFIQDSLSENTLLLVVNNEFDNRDKHIITNRFIEILGEEPKIKIVDEITALKSGKRPYIISNYKKKSTHQSQILQ
ncbi:phenylacetate--CoA ligase family protein [Ureibacillus manganicus]|uniref:AMP-dependent synthetase/ligase domain-containing protein n=1 Tax=Ureibacillus manganicus DSM 26584 TaxID=1384049 RepID=A0A0A3I374_9BACL|nr:phenylacetate--CoA ligase family protein [Ureibacillus manganicus]KGR79179.1 hypothetical protein CD29_07465 [Ureibacillus manganicus DSM 26584]